MRLRPGEQVQVVDGAGVRLTGQVAAVDGGAHLDLDVLSVEREQAPGCRLVLVQALAKGGRDELAIEVGTEVGMDAVVRSEEHTSELQSRGHIVCRLLLEKKKMMAAEEIENDRRRKSSETVQQMAVK